MWQVITVQAVINNVNKTFTLNNLSSVSKRLSDIVIPVDDDYSDDDLTNNDDDGVTMTFNLKHLGLVKR